MKNLLTPVLTLLIILTGWLGHLMRNHIAAFLAVVVMTVLSVILLLLSLRKSRVQAVIKSEPQQDTDLTMAETADCRPSLDKLALLCCTSLNPMEYPADPITANVLDDLVDTLINRLENLDILYRTYLKMPAISSLTKHAMLKTENATQDLMESFVSLVEMNNQAWLSAQKTRNQLTNAETGVDLAAQVRESSQTMAEYHQMVDNMILINQDIASRISNMDHSIQLVADKIRSIVEIADQNKVIYLNLSIEAVQLGQKGKGIQVIVQEIQKMNTKTKEFITDIRSIIKQVKEKQAELESFWTSSTQDMIEKINQSGNKAQNVFTSFGKSLETGQEFFDSLYKNTTDIHQSATGMLEKLQFQDITRQQMENILEQMNIIWRSHQNLIEDWDYLKGRLEQIKPSLVQEIKEDLKKHAKVIDEKELIEKLFS